MPIPSAPLPFRFEELSALPTDPLGSTPSEDSTSRAPFKRSWLGVQRSVLAEDGDGPWSGLSTTDLLKKTAMTMACALGEMGEARESGSCAALAPILAEALKAALRSCSRLNVAGFPGGAEFSHEAAMLMGFGASRSPQWLLANGVFEMAPLAGACAKAIEALDHVERFPSREALEDGLPKLARFLAGALALADPSSPLLPSPKPAASARP